MNELMTPGQRSESLSDAGLEALTHAGLDPLFWPAERLGEGSAWWQHVAFAHWIVAVAKPSVLVELGTHAGVSYAAFCQAVIRTGLPTRCHAVDTWTGDQHAGAYDDGIFADLSQYNQEKLSSFSTLIRSTFDEALPRIEDHAIDLLHVDGMHTYEAVRHDFDSWRVKLSDRAVVLFHDINERSGDFGVWRLWNELTQQYPSFTFLHGFGLGVLAVGEQVPEPVLALCRLDDAAEIARVRTRFARLGERWLVDTRERMLAARLGEVDAARAELAAIPLLKHERDAALAARDLALTEAAQAREAREAAVQRAEADSERAATAAARTAAARQEAIAAAAALRENQANAEAALRDLRAEMQRLRAERDAIANSTTWRVTGVLRRGAEKLPRPIRRALRGTAKLAYWTATLQLSSKLKERRTLVRQ